MCLLSYVRFYLCVSFLILSCIDVSKSSLPDGFSCVQKGACNCTGTNGEILDLSPLAESNQPLLAATNSHLYIYHPCSDILVKQLEVKCQKSFGLCHYTPNQTTDKTIDYNQVLLNTSLGTFKKLAVNNEAIIRPNEKKQLEIIYKHTINDATTISTTIKLDCNENVDTYKLVIDKSEPSEHILTLTSHYACVKGPHYMSGWSVFFLILVILFLIYFVGGILVLRFIRGATGIEMIPNHEFWCNVPQMAKDGVKYLLTCGKSTPDSYEKI